MDNLRIEVMALSEKAKIQIHQYIATMDLDKTNKLPREETLAEIIGVSRITLRSALNDLASEGIIFRRQGKGTFVNVDSLNMKVKFNPVMEFTDMITNSGFTPSVRLLGIRFAPQYEPAAKILSLAPDDRLVMCEKMFFADEKLCAYCIDYFPLSVIGGESAFEDFTHYENSVFLYIYRHSGRKIVWDKVKIGASKGRDIPGLSKHISDKSIATKPFLQLEGINYDTDDYPILLAKEYIDTDIIQFNMIRQRNISYTD